jgi:hypothetical protein
MLPSSPAVAYRLDVIDQNLLLTSDILFLPGSAPLLNDFGRVAERKLRLYFHLHELITQRAQMMRCITKILYRTYQLTGRKQDPNPRDPTRGCASLGTLAIPTGPEIPSALRNFSARPNSTGVNNLRELFPLDDLLKKCAPRPAHTRIRTLANQLPESIPRYTQLQRR